MLTLVGVLLAVLVTWGVNPVYSILTLITSALTLGIILLSHGLEFVPFLIVLIYVGAVAVLFLFVVMMINFKLDQQKFYLPESFLFWLLTGINLIYTVEPVPLNYKLNFFWADKSNFYSLGSYLYNTNLVLLVGLVGLVLFVAMIGAISLTYISSENYRSQNIPTQTRRTSSLYRLEKNFYDQPLQSGLVLPSSGGLERPVTYIAPFFILIFWIVIYELDSFPIFMELYLVGLGFTVVTDRFRGAIKYWFLPWLRKNKKDPN